MNFNETIKNLKSNNNVNSIIKDCLNEMTNGEVLFNPGFVKDKKELTSLYALRLRIAKGLGEHVSSNNDIKSWEIAVEDLKESKSNSLKLSWIHSNSKTYFLFWDFKTKRLEAVFHLESKRSIKESVKINDQTLIEGRNVSSVYYVKGKMIKNW